MVLPSHMWQDDGPSPEKRQDTTDADGTKREQREAPLRMGHGRVFNLFKNKRTEHGSHVQVPFCRSIGFVG